MSAQSRFRGITVEQEHQARGYHRDVRRFGQQFSDAMDSPMAVAIGFGMLAVLVTLIPGTVWICPIPAAILLLMHVPRRKPVTLPLRLPASTKRIDFNNPMPGRKKFFRARGLIYEGNAVETENGEIWADKTDALTHKLLIGTTGAGKTVTLVSEAANYIGIGGGLMYVDAKAAPALQWDIAALARRMGREDDLQTINYMTGNAAVTSANGVRLTNTANPLAVGSGDSLVQMLSSLIPTPEGDNAVFGERALNMITGLLYALVDLRDGGYLDLGVATLRDNLPLERYEAVAFDPRLRTQAAKAATMAYLRSLPTWKPLAEREAAGKRGQPEPIGEEAYRQHGFAQMYFTRALSSLTDTYGHIYNGVQGEVDPIDSVRQRRILTVLLPALEKSPAELQNLGKINLSSIRDAISSGLGSALEGDRTSVLESLPTASAIPSKIICDEYGYMAVEGFAIVAAQARGLGFSVTFAGQDWAGIKRGSEKEAEQIWSNCKLKFFGTLLDNESFQRLTQATGEAAITETSGFNSEASGLGSYADSQAATVQRRSRVDVRDLANQIQGETHIVFGGDLIRANVFYANPKPLPELRINRYLRVGEKVVGAEQSAAPIKKDPKLRPVAGNGPVKPDEKPVLPMAAIVQRSAPPLPPPIVEEPPPVTKSARPITRPSSDEIEQAMRASAAAAATVDVAPPTSSTTTVLPPALIDNADLGAVLEAAGFDEAAITAATSNIVESDDVEAQDYSGVDLVDDPIDLTIDRSLLGEGVREESISAIEAGLQAYPEAEVRKAADDLTTDRMSRDLQHALDHFLGNL